MWVKDLRPFLCVRTKVDNWKRAAFKHKWTKYRLLTKLRLPKNHSKASHPPHQPWKTLNFGKRKQKWQKGGGDREEALSRDVIHTATYIFLLFLTTDKCAKGGRLSLPFSLSPTHMLRYFLLGVWDGQTVLWVTDWALKWAPFSLIQCSFPRLLLLPPFPPFTVVSVS